MIRVLFFIPIFIVTFANLKNAVCAPTRKVIIGNNFVVSFHDGEDLLVSVSSGFQTGLFKNKKGKATLVAKDFPPQSIVSVRKRADEVGVSSKDIRAIRYTDKSLFYFHEKNQIHVFSTLGGRILISKSGNSNFGIDRISLRENARNKGR